MKKIFLGFLFGILSISADDIQAYGKLGNLDIHILLSDYGDTCDMRYYYDSQLMDIQMGECNVNENGYTIDLDHHEGQEEEHFMLTKIGNKLKGSWHQNSKTSLQVLLDITPLCYTKYREDHLTFKRSKIEKSADEKQIVWMQEVHSDVEYPRVEFDTNKYQKLNQRLEEEHKNFALNHLTCTSSHNYGSGMETTSIEVEFLSDDFISISSLESYYCGGAHPDFSSYGSLIELKSGTRYEIDEILAFDVIPPKYIWGDSGEAFSAYAKYRNEHFAPKIKKLVFESQGWDPNEKVDPDDCDYTDEELWDFPSWYATEKGLAITPIFARAMRCCEEPFVIPYHLLEKYKNPNFPYRLENIAR